MDGELKFGLSLSTIWETFSDIFWMVLIGVGLSLSTIWEPFSDIFWMVLISVAMVRAERSEKVAERRDMVLVLFPVKL